MKWFHIILKNLFRNRRRTFLTMVAVALALFIFTMLQTIITALEISVARGPGETRVAVIEKSSGPRTQLPISYWRRLRRFDHVTASTPMGYTITSVGWAEEYYIALLVDPETYREVFPTTVRMIPHQQYNQFVKLRNGVLVGAEIMRKYDWKVGQEIKLQSLQHKVTMDLIICGVLKNGTTENQQMETQMLINWNYYDGLIGNPGKVNIFWLRLDRPSSTLPVINNISNYYSAGPLMVSVETESSMLNRLTSYTATIQLIIQVISTVVLFTILMVTVNTIALSTRERKKEIAVMKAIGFTPRRVLWMIVNESIITSLIAGLLGTMLAYVLFNIKGLTLSMGLTFDFVVHPRIVVTGIVISLLLGAVSGFIPAYNASKINVIKALHNL